MQNSKTEDCRSCGEPLFEKALLDKTNFAMTQESRIDLHQDGKGRYFECAECGAKNRVIVTDGQIVIIGAEKS